MFGGIVIAPEVQNEINKLNARLDYLNGVVEGLHVLVHRQQQALRAIHRGLHDVTDPGLNERTPRHGQ
jgi:hypothetical protein